MARDYQRQKNNKYILPNAVYNQVVWIIRDYDRMNIEAEAILHESPAPSDGMPHGTNTSDPVEAKAIKREEYMHKIMLIDNAKKVVPDIFMKHIWLNVVYRTPFPTYIEIENGNMIYVDRSTFGRKKSRFIYEVAKNFKLV